MRRFVKLSTCLIFCCIWSVTALYAQLLPANQPEQDACSALRLCGNFFTPYGYQGEGSTADLTNTPCAAPGVYTGESNAIWLRLEVNSPGSIVFAINPVDPQDDYDFAVLNITNGDCNNLLFSQVVRCNFNNNEQPNTFYSGGIIGLNSTSIITSAAGGVYGQPFLQQINAGAGDVYLIMINNYGHDNCFGTCPGSGFLLDFTGSTATFNQPPPPAYDHLIYSCDYAQQATVQLDQNILCSSIAADGSDFYLTPVGIIAAATGVNCTGGAGYTDKVILTFTNGLPDGDYYIRAKIGTDGNSLLGLCNSPLAIPDSLKFHVGKDPITMVSVDSPACQSIKIQLNTPALCAGIAPDGSDFEITGPDNVTIASATGAGCVAGGITATVELILAQPIETDGTYYIQSKVGNDGNTLYDSCGRVLAPSQRIKFTVNSFNGQLTALPDSTLCNIGQTVTLYGINNGLAPAGGFSYQWLSNASIQDPNSLSTPVTVPGFFNYYVLETIDANSCYIRDSAKIRVIPFLGTLTPSKSESCIGDALLLHAGAGAQYNWFADPSLSTIPDNTAFNCTDCPDPKVTPPLGESHYYVLITDSRGCADTLETKVVVHEKPSIISLPADTTIRYGSSITLYAFGGQYYSWTPLSTLSNDMSGNPTATPQKPTTYIVNGWNRYGCMSSDTSFVDIDFRATTMIPNAFSPNGDGLNDEFKVMNIGFRRLILFQVFDRWGKEVFNTLDPNKGWNGYYRGEQMNAGVYHYYIKLGYADDMVETFKGDVTLIR